MKTLKFFLIFVLMLGLSYCLANAIDIYDWEDLDSIRGDLGGSYTLMNNITPESDPTGYDTYASSSANGGAGWLPIDNFVGTLSGNGYVIDGLYMNRPDSVNGVGLFSSMDNATIYSLGVTNADIHGGQYTGILAGNISDYTCVTGGCYTSGNVSGTYDVGGIVGKTTSSVTSDCFSIATVEGTGGSVGGLVGTCLNAGIATSYFNGASVSAGSYNVGGLVGNLQGVSGAVTNSFAVTNVTGNISTDYVVGPVIGFLDVESAYNYCFYYGTTVNNGGGLINTYGFNIGNPTTFYGSIVSGLGWRITGAESTWIPRVDNYPLLRWLAENWIATTASDLGLAWEQSDLDNLIANYINGVSAPYDLDGMPITYLSGTLPGDTGYDYGESWTYNGITYLKMGSGFQFGDASVPEPLTIISFAFLTLGLAAKRFKK